MTDRLTRRGFLQGAAATIAAGAAVGMLGCSQKEAPQEEKQDERAWEAEADYVIVGTGAAGLSAAATCGLENLGSALILEAAPEDLRGGNSRVCGQGTFCPTSVEGAIEYQTDLNLPYVVEEDLMQAWAENICENGTWLSEECGADIEFKQSAEFPEAKAADTAGHYASKTKRDDSGSGGIWKALEDTVASFGTPLYTMPAPSCSCMTRRRRRSMASRRKTGVHSRPTRPSSWPAAASSGTKT